MLTTFTNKYFKKNPSECHSPKALKKEKIKKKTEWIFGVDIKGSNCVSMHTLLCPLDLNKYDGRVQMTFVSFPFC